MELFVVGLLLVAVVLLVLRRLWLGATGRSDSCCGSCSSRCDDKQTCGPDRPADDRQAGRQDADPPDAPGKPGR